MAKGDDAVRSQGRPRHFQVTVAVAVVLLAVGVGVSVALTRSNRAHKQHHAASERQTKPVAPLSLVSVTPRAGASSIAFHPKIALRFSSALSSHSPVPTLSPPVAGHWSRVGSDTIVFQPSAEFFPLERVRIDVPGGENGVVATDGARLQSDVTSQFTVKDASVLRMQQLLAELGYLPVAFNPSSLVATTDSAHESAPATPGGSSDANALAAEPTVPDAISLSAIPGAFAWRYSTVPSQLSSLWTPGSFSVVTQGAVMAFEADHRLGIDGVAGATFWHVLLDAVAQRVATTRAYTWVVISETTPQTLYVWRAGRVVYQSLTNTGVAAAPTELGTWPVYLRFASVTMAGTNPDGTHYDDPGVPWVAYFHGGDAVHGFIRASYGFPQSDGCVELPIENAAIVYPYDTYGTLVTVTTGNLSAQLGAPPA